MTTQVYVAFGSNLGDRCNHLSQGLSALQQRCAQSNWQVSSWYDSDPVGPEQPAYLNGVCGFVTALPALQLLDQMQAIEAESGRPPEAERQHWGPRTLDLDLLLFGDEQLNTPRLQVPHPRLQERAFVLLPLMELAAELPVPGLGTVSELCQGLDLRGLRPFT